MAMAGFASSAALTYHWSVSHGSMTTLERSPCGTVCVVGSIFSKRPSAAEIGDDALARLEAVEPAVGRRRTSLIRAWSSSTLICSSPCRLPTSKSLKSCAGVIFTAPVPFSGSEYSSATIGISRPTSGSFTLAPALISAA